jgi:hypothetical protein
MDEGEPKTWPSAECTEGRRWTEYLRASLQTKFGPAESQRAILYFKRHRSDDSAETRPGRVYLNGLPPQIRARLVAVIKAVADAPPPAHSGGGKWEVMKGDMAGYYHVKADGFENGRRLHFRVSCLLERQTAANGWPGPSLIILGGMTKPYLTVFSTADYARIRALGDEYLSWQPRSVAL